MGERREPEVMDELIAVVGAFGLELVDLEVSAVAVRVTVDRAGGVDLAGLAEANRAVSAVLDRLDPVAGRYTLEVSSPGLERRLRTPAHFARAIGELVSIVFVPGFEVRRLRGVVTAVDGGRVTIEGPEVPSGAVEVACEQIERARTVFEWGARPAPSPSRAKPSGSRRTAAHPRVRARTP